MSNTGIYTAAQPVMVNFSPNLSDDEFMSYLKKEGLSAKDCEIMRGKTQQITTKWNLDYNKNHLLTVNGIGAMTFATDFRDEDVSSPELGFTFGGKRVLRRLLRVCVLILLMKNHQSKTMKKYHALTGSINQCWSGWPGDRTNWYSVTTCRINLVWGYKHVPVLLYCANMYHPST